MKPVAKSYHTHPKMWSNHNKRVPIMMKATYQ